MKPSSLLHAIGRPIAFNPGLVPILGSIKAVLFFGQIYFWMNHTNHPDGVYKSADEIESETGLSYREQVSAREKLVELGVLVETHKRLEHRIYFRIDSDALDALLADYINRISRTDKSAVLETTKAQSVELTKAQSVIQRIPENTSETTTAAPARDSARAEKHDRGDGKQSPSQPTDSRADVVMSAEWQPSSAFATHLKMAAIAPERLTDFVLTKFRMHHVGITRKQNQWEVALLNWIKGKSETATVPRRKASRHNNLEQQEHFTGGF